MTTLSKRCALPFVLAVAAFCALTLVASAAATPIANKFTLSRNIGWEVNATTGAGICTAASKNVCQAGRESEEPGGFKYLQSVAVDNDPESPNYGNVYVADRINHRVQELTAAGEFVLMFGKDVNETTGASVCTAEEIKTDGVKCKAGEIGDEAGAFVFPSSVAVDPATGNIYVVDTGASSAEVPSNDRVDEYTANGQFVLTIGKEVNARTKGNLCTQEEILKSGVKCKAGVEDPGTTEPGAFVFLENSGNLLAVGGPDDLLYVGGEHRVQEFAADGQYKDEISLTSISSEQRSHVDALAVDPAGNVYLAYEVGNGLQIGNGFKVEPTDVIHEFRQDDVQIAEFEVAPRETDQSKITEFGIKALALDPYGRLAVVSLENFTGFHGENIVKAYGALLTTTGTLISEFAPPSGEISTPFVYGVAFSSSDELYLAADGTQQIEAYVPALFPEVSTCQAEAVTATSATLCGEINPNGLLTQGFFEYGPPSGSRTAIAFESEGSTFEAAHWQLGGLEPNETYDYKALAEAELAGEPVKGAGEEVKFHTATPPVAIVGEPAASFVKASSAVLNASLNPEHAKTVYRFQYEQCDSLGECAAPQATPAEESSQYGVIGASQEVTDLQPQSTYRYWLVANNEHEEAGKMQGGAAIGAEGTFTTGPSPVPQAVTGIASAVAATSATVSGTVNPDGQPATYEFEVGVYAGSLTHYGIVFSGSAGAGTEPVTEELGITGLQPGTVYAYRIKILSGYGIETGQAMSFTTAGLPEVLVSPTALARLAVPAIAFPPPVPAKPAAKPLTNAQKLAKALKACKKQSKRTRASCEKQARRKYRTSGQANERKKG